MTQDTYAKKTIDHIYNPDNQTKEELIDSFVVRLKTFQRLFDDIKQSTMKAPEQHYLIEGKRGMGKTTLLLRLSYEIENDKSLNSWLIPIVFNEEEYSIRKLYKLWERIAELLEQNDDQFIGLFDEMDRSFENYSSEKEYEYAIFNLLNQRLEEKGKKLILFIDNFGDIFQKFDKREIQELRTILQTNVNLRIFAASSTVLEAFYDQKHPFFEFFKVTRLKGLDKKEAQDLLLKLGEAYKQEQIKEIIANQPGRVEALRRLTGGVIRTIVLLFEIFIDKKDGTAFSDLETILDRVTPLYKHRMDDLPAQQQEIVEAIALAWDAINVSEISQKTRIPSKTVSAQLRQMEKNEIITKKLTSTKNHLYQLSERFFNIWYLMRHGRKGDKRKVLWLVRFLEEWCDEEELVARAQQHISALKKDKYNVNGAYYLAEALASTKGLPAEYQNELLKVTRDFLTKKKSEFAKHISESDIELQEQARIYFKREDFQKALDRLRATRQPDYFAIGMCFFEMGDFIKSESEWLKAVKENNSYAMVALATLYQFQFNDIKKAEYYYLLAAKEGNIDAMFSLANLYNTDKNKIEKAETYFQKAAKGGHIKAMFNLANLYYNKNNMEKAESYYLRAVEQGDANAMNNLAMLYEHQKSDFQKAESFYLRAIEKGNSGAMNNIALLYEEKLNDSRKAEYYFLKAIEGGYHGAIFNIAVMYHMKLKDFKQAELYYQQAVGMGFEDAMNNLAVLYFAQKQKKISALELSKKAYEDERDRIACLTYSMMLAWNNKLTEAEEVINEVLYDNVFIDEKSESFQNFLMLLLAKNETQFLYNYFTSPQAKELALKDQFKPIWYALMYYMKDQYPNEYLRMGEELEETVQEIIAKVEQMRIDYA